MTEDELKRLFRKQVPDAYQSLKEAASMTESKAKRYKVETASKTILGAQDVLLKCWGQLSWKDELLLVHIVENVPKEVTANILYENEERNNILKAKSLEGWALKRLYKTLQRQLVAPGEEQKRSIEQRIKARQERLG